MLFVKTWLTSEPLALISSFFAMPLIGLMLIFSEELVRDIRKWDKRTKILGDIISVSQIVVLNFYYAAFSIP